MSAFSNSYTANWSSPSNIALVKYWGKHGVQLPKNPSISITLDKARTETKLSWYPYDNREIEVLLDGESTPSFVPKIETFLSLLPCEYDCLQEGKLVVQTRNTFPHSAGIASSASGMSALALCIAEIRAEAFGVGTPDVDHISYLSRLGSGSASRSVIPHYALWGEIDGVGSDEYAVVLKEIHRDFSEVCDTIFLIDEGEKKVSSTVGHGLMNDHLYAEIRFEEARVNTRKLFRILREGGWDEFGAIVEKEALSLHSMMMTSNTPYLLLKPKTISLIEEILKLREKKGVPAYFTLDAGPNIHLLYPKRVELEMTKFASEMAEKLDIKTISDHIGDGPRAFF